MNAIFLRVIEADDKAAALRETILAREFAQRQTRFDVDPGAFRQVPGAPFGYWVSDRLRGLFIQEQSVFDARRGPSTSDDSRYLRLFWESRTAEHGFGRWVPFAKGGSYSPYYADVHLVVDWEPRRRTFFGFFGRPGRWITRPESVDCFFRPGLTWPLRTQRGLSVRIMAGGCIFGHKGPAAFVEGDDRQALLALAAITNSRPFAALVEVQMAFGSYEVGVIQRTPVPALTPSDRDPLAGLALRAWSLKRTLDTRTETSHAFVLTSLLQVGEPTLIARAQAWQTRVVEAEAQLARLQDEVDERCFGLYNIDLEDRGRIERRFGAPGDAEGYEEDGEADELDEEPEEVDPAPMIASLLSWAFGVVLGRFDVRLATGDREPPPEPEPFDPLPACSPGMLTGDDGLPLATPPAGYPIAFPRDGILVDDEGHDRDLVASVQRVFELTFDDAPTRWREAAEVLDERNPDLRSWFAKSFFEFHVKRYSKSRRKAPIYWQLATPSASYSVWLYYHRFTRDTLFTLLKDHVAPKLQHEERKLAGLTQEVGSNPTVAQRREIEAQEQFVAELRSFRDEVARVAPLWNPNLNDGVLINFAPLWRLVPQHRSWQRECKATWDKLCSGDYDWAHLAMHFWPERVVPKCAEDRSLAIAHGLEDIFWYEDADGKWQARDVESAEIERLIEERTSSAVEDALKSLLEAPVPSGSRGRGRGRRASKLSRRPKVPTGGRASTVQRSERRRLTAELLRRVKEAIAANGDGATKADVLKATGIAASDWNSAIQALLADGSVRRTGERRGARYHLVESDG